MELNYVDEVIISSYLNKVNCVAVIMNKYMNCTDRRVQQLHKTLSISVHMNIQYTSTAVIKI